MSQQTEDSKDKGAEGRRGSPKYFFMGLGGAAVFIALFGIVFSTVLNLGTKSVERGVDAYFAAFNSGDYASLYAQGDDALREGTSEEEFIGSLKKIHDTLGDYQGKTPRGLTIEGSRQGTVTVATFDATFGNGPATAAFTFVGSGDKQKLSKVEYRSRLLPDSRRGRRRG